MGFVRLAGAVALAFCLLCAGPAARAADPITIGFGMALTGNIAANGRAALIAMKLWEEDTNKAGGLLGRPVKLVYYDDQSTPPNVPAIYTKLLDVDKVDIVVSGYGTNMTVPAMPVVMAHNRMFMTLFALGINAEFNYPRFFGMIPAGPAAGAKKAFSKGFFDVAKGMTPPARTVAIVSADAEASRNAVEGALDNIKEAGLEIVYNRSYPPATTDYSPIVRSVQAAHADVLYVASYPADTVGIVNALHEVGLKARLVGGSMVGPQTTSIKTQLGPKLNGLVVYNFWLPTPATMYPGIEDFLKRYQAEAVKEGVDQLGYYLPPFAYAYLQVVGDAIKGAGTLDQDRLTAWIHAHTFHTIVGDVAFGPDGDWMQAKILTEQFHDVKGNDVAQFRDGKVETLLEPAALQSGKLVEPYSNISH
ncbi:MAG TPA: amino acid ABC transporter substrate-binding protein [Rhodopila sp.]|uniref:amino acid ABC transporter substrate-binding protein n=1 Tax=Rhodopila sp. TaxID=2480087 RepID=UPI002CD88818|nr:amino acid ABC transporter substrate-binding protein [Rhodopila sp.]HVY17126.1 amino acid ABC transporter substrate-binding protein [Rhodopila sp.]HWB98189.1 amino acid ABC transporter substrate-binding protein [Bryobacteraceae bacterium]